MDDVLLCYSDEEEVHKEKKSQGKTPGASCSKLTTLLVNVSLKLKMLILQIQLFFVGTMWESFVLQKILTFFQQNNSGFDKVLGIYWTNWRLNNVVRLTILWTIGPRLILSMQWEYGDNWAASQEHLSYGFQSGTTQTVF